ncbi:MAG: SGNH/GDSL hydrolase family protein [Akkermansiaceae bacterium]|nr:SGNH/GDSL hydrolase family protein [Akkermansiaceae bacterium]
MPKAFSRLAKSQGKSVFVDQSIHNGWTLGRHAESEQTLQKIRERKWDIVVLQEQSTIPAKSRIERELLMYPPLRKLAGEIRRQGALPILYQTWGRRDHFLPMNARIRAGYREAAKDAGGIAVVPVGDAWEKAILAGKGSDLFMKDGSHPTVAGNSLTARTFLGFVYP